MANHLILWIEVNSKGRYGNLPHHMDQSDPQRLRFLENSQLLVKIKALAHGTDQPLVEFEPRLMEPSSFGQI